MGVFNTAVALKKPCADGFKKGLFSGLNKPGALLGRWAEMNGYQRGGQECLLPTTTVLIFQSVSIASKISKLICLTVEHLEKRVPKTPADMILLQKTTVNIGFV